MLNFKVLSMLIIMSTLTHNLKASNIEEESLTHHNISKNALIPDKSNSSPSLIGNIWHKLTSTFSILLPNSTLSPSQSAPKVSKLDNISWHTIIDQPGLEWQQEGSELLYHVATLSHNNLNNFFTYLDERLSNSLTAKAFTSHPSFAGKRKFLFSNYRQIKEIEVDEGNLPQFIESYINFYEELNKEGLPALIQKDYTTYTQTSSEDEIEFMEPNYFQQGVFLAESLGNMRSYECREENLPYLSRAVKTLYRKLDGGKLQEDSIRTLRRLGIHIPQKVDWSRVAKGATFLLLLSSANFMPAVAAQRPQLLEDVCSGTYKECESAFALLDCCGFGDEIDTMFSNPNYDGSLIFGFTNPTRRFAIADEIGPTGIVQQLQNSGYYSEINSFRIGASPLSNTSIEFYNLFDPYIGYTNTKIDDSFYNHTTYQIFDPLTVNISSTLSASTLSGSLNPFYLSQFPSSEILLFTSMNNDGSFGIGNAVLRPASGKAYLLWQRLITNETAINRVIPSNLSSTPIIASKPSTASDRDNKTFNDFLNSFYSGYVDSPNGQNSRTIQQFTEDNNLIPNGIINCLQGLGLDPLSCSSFLSTGNYARLIYYFVEKYKALHTVTTNVVDGPVVTNTINYELNSTNIRRLTHSYVWNPTIQEPSTDNTVVFDSISPLLSNLTDSTAEKFAEFYLPNSTAAIVLRVSQSVSGSPVNYYAILGPEIVAAAAPPSNSSSSDGSSSAVLGAAIGVPIGVAALCAAGVGAGVGTFAWYKHKKHKREKAFAEAEENMEMGSRSPSMVSPDAFKAVKGKGLKDARLRVTGAMHGLEYGLYFKISEKEAKEINAQTGLKITIPEGQSRTPFHLGAGNFGKVVIAKEENTGAFRAMKIVAGTKSVESSLREGKLQESLGQIEGVLPLLEYLHFKPTEEHEDTMRDLLEETFGSTTIRGENMITQDLLLQVTPLASFGSGEVFQQSLARISKHKLKDQLLTHFARSLLTGLAHMHDNGVSHLDLKPTNVLVHSDGTVYISDFGCALQKDKIIGGLGDFRYFSPDRIAHCRLLMQERQGRKFKAKETAKFFSGKKADTFAAGLTLLEIATNNYPFPMKGVEDIVNKGDSAYFDENLEKVYAEIGEEWSILPIIKDLLQSDPTSRWSAFKAQQELQKIKLKSSGEELFEAFNKKLAKEDSNFTKKAGNTTEVPSYSAAGSSSIAYQSKLPAKEGQEEVMSSQQAYGAEMPSLYKKLQEAYKDSDEEDDLGWDAGNYAAPKSTAYDNVGLDSQTSTYSDVPPKFKLEHSNDNRDPAYSTERLEFNPEQSSKKKGKNIVSY
ncbi:MAG: protein kinase [Alphaproteobacteria bacterium]|nr:protein kinase [Alphaproteobacteria bacterium]